MNVGTFVILFAVAMMVAWIARRVGLPYTVGLVVAGLALGRVDGLRAPHLTHDLLFSLLLPALVFEAAFHIDGKQLWKDHWIVNALATPGLLLAMVLTAALLVRATDFEELAGGIAWSGALVFAAVVSATDPIAVVALFRSVGAPQRLSVLVEGESLLNDGTGIVIFGIALSAATGSAFSWSGAVLEFIRVVGLGAMVGAALGTIVAGLGRLVDHRISHVAITVLAAYGSFALADRLGGSGVISTLVTGLIARRHAMRTLETVEKFWEYVAFAMNSFVFLLIGLEVSSSALMQSWKAIGTAYAAATIARAVMVVITTGALRHTALRLPWRWAVVIGWSGLRGALSLVLVLGLPPTFPGRDVLVNMTFGFVLLTLLVQGTTMKPILKLLRLSSVTST
ncbi:MAG: sodium:proton antiporter [Deltaproteobacteria bacterium]|nr:sodium:proton antiporter [Deltaproteobacteria bacterium]